MVLKWGSKNLRTYAAWWGFFVFYSVAAMLMSPSQTHAQQDVEGCSDDNPAVQLRQGEIQVSPISASGEEAGVNDTQNLQCAVEEAKRLGIATVRLIKPLNSDEPAEFRVESVVLEDFEGSLVGSGQQATIVKVGPESIDCAAVIDNGRYPAVFKVIGGNTRIAQLSIETDSVCQGSNRNFAVVHFTGSATSQECSENGSSSSVVSGLVERTSITSLSFDASGTPVYEGTAILSAAEGAMLSNQCDDKQLGSLRVVRNKIEGYFAGLQTRMQGGAQVDVNFNEFIDVPTAVGAFNANQIMNIQGNSVMFDDSSVLSYSIWIDKLVTRSNDSIPLTNRTVIYDNRFVINAAAHSMAVRAVSPDSDAVVDLEVSVTGNEFDWQDTGSDVIGVYLLDLSFANVSRNRFLGGPVSSVPAAIFFDSAEEPARRSTVSYNNFKEYTGQRGIVFTQGTSNNIVSPLQLQDAVISDAGDNIILQ